MPAKDLLDNRFDERERLAVSACREAMSSYHGINFGLGFLLGFWKKCHGQEECIYGRNGLIEYEQMNPFERTDTLTVSTPPSKYER